MWLWLWWREHCQGWEAEGRRFCVYCMPSSSFQHSAGLQGGTGLKKIFRMFIKLWVRCSLQPASPYDFPNDLLFSSVLIPLKMNFFLCNNKAKHRTEQQHWQIALLDMKLLNKASHDIIGMEIREFGWTRHPCCSLSFPTKWFLSSRGFGWTGSAAWAQEEAAKAAGASGP